MYEHNGGVSAKVGGVEEGGDTRGGFHARNDHLVGVGDHPDRDIMPYHFGGSERKRVSEFFSGRKVN